MKTKCRISKENIVVNIYRPIEGRQIQSKQINETTLIDLLEYLASQSIYSEYQVILSRIVFNGSDLLANAFQGLPIICQYLPSSEELPWDIIVHNGRIYDYWVLKKEWPFGEDFEAFDLGQGYGAIVYEINLGKASWPMIFQGDSTLKQWHIDEDFTITKLEDIRLEVDVEIFRIGSKEKGTNHTRALARELPAKSSFDEAAHQLTVSLIKFKEGTEQEISSRQVVIKIPIKE